MAALGAMGLGLLPGILSMFGKGKTRDVRTKEEKRLDKMRSQLQETALGKMIGQLSGMDKEEFVKRRMADFERTTAPQIAETASATSGLRGSDYLSAMAGAATKAEEGAESDFFNQLNTMLGMAGQQQPRTGYKVPEPGIGGMMAGALGPFSQGMGALGTMGMADKFGLFGERGSPGTPPPEEKGKVSQVGGS